MVRAASLSITRARPPAGGREHRMPILASLPLLDANGHARRIEVADARVQQLGEPHARRVNRENHRAMFQIPHLCDQPRDFGTAEDRRERARTARRRHTERHAVALQRGVIRQAQSLHDDVAGTPRSLPLANQVQQVTPESPDPRSDRVTVDKMSPVRSRPTGRSPASDRPSRAPACRRPSVGVAPSSHTSSDTRRAHLLGRVDWRGVWQRIQEGVGAPEMRPTAQRFRSTQSG